MATNRNLTSAIVSAVIGCLAAFLTCLIFFYFVYKQARPVDAQPPQPAPSASPVPTPVQEIPNPEIKAADVSSVRIKTVYTGYFEPTDKCSKNYNEYFGNSDGSFSPSSPCTVVVTYTRDGTATRSLEIRRWDRTAKDFQIVERSDATAKTTPDQFESLVEKIVMNEAFRSWREGTLINVSNCSITAEYSKGSKTAMSNVDENTTVFLRMVDAFKQLEKQLKWVKTQ